MPHAHRRSRRSGASARRRTPPSSCRCTMQLARVKRTVTTCPACWAASVRAARRRRRPGTRRTRRARRRGSAGWAGGRVGRGRGTVSRRPASSARRPAAGRRSCAAGRPCPRRGPGRVGAGDDDGGHRRRRDAQSPSCSTRRTHRRPPSSGRSQKTRWRTPWESSADTVVSPASTSDKKLNDRARVPARCWAAGRSAAVNGRCAHPPGAHRRAAISSRVRRLRWRLLTGRGGSAQR